MKKPVPDRDDLYSWLYHHMVFDDSVFPDERQRLQHATGILMNAFFGCRLCSLFDIRVKLDLPNIDDISLNDSKVLRDNSTNNKLKDDILMTFNPDCDSNKLRMTRNSNNDSSSDDDKTACGDEEDGNLNTPYDDDSDSDSNSLYEVGSNSDTDDECTAGFEETRSFLYRHFTIYIVPNPDPEKPNTIFTKITLIQSSRRSH